MDGSIAMYLLAVNLLTLFLMRVDKQKAIKGHFRIPERTFFFTLHIRRCFRYLYWDEIIPS